MSFGSVTSLQVTTTLLIHIVFYRYKYIKTANDAFPITYYYRDNSACELSTNHKTCHGKTWDKLFKT